MLLLPLIMTSEALHVSFLGNSFTYFNDLPSCVVSACRAAGVGATAAEHTVGGEALSGHLENERARALLAAPADALVVQDNSVNPGRASEERFEDSLRALDDIAERAAHVEHVVVRAEPKKKRVRGDVARPRRDPSTDDCPRTVQHLVAQVVVYGSWGHRDGSVYEATRDAYPDFPTMQRRTEEGCEAYVNRLAARRPRGRVSLAPVGDAFRRVYPRPSGIASSLRNPVRPAPPP